MATPTDDRAPELLEAQRTWIGDDCPEGWKRVGTIDVADPADAFTARDRGYRIGTIYEGGSGSVAEPCAADTYARTKLGEDYDELVWKLDDANHDLATLQRQVAEAEASDAESLAMYRRARDRAEAVTAECDALAETAGEALADGIAWYALALNINSVNTRLRGELATAEARAREAEARAEDADQNAENWQIAYLVQRHSGHGGAMENVRQWAETGAVGRIAWERGATFKPWADSVGIVNSSGFMSLARAALSPPDPTLAESAGHAQESRDAV